MNGQARSDAEIGADVPSDAPIVGGNSDHSASTAHSRSWAKPEFSPTEVGRLLGLSRQFVDRLIDLGDLPARQLPGSAHHAASINAVEESALTAAFELLQVDDDVDVGAGAAAEVCGLVVEEELEDGFEGGGVGGPVGQGGVVGPSQT